MEVITPDRKETGATRADVIRGITLAPPVIGRIAAGHTVIRNDRALPVRDDHFTLTTLVQDKNSRAFVEHPLQKTLVDANEKLCAIPVTIAYNNVNLNLNNKYSAFDPKKGRAVCVGNGDTARRMTDDGIKEMDCPRPEACAFGQTNRCKNFTRAYFRVDGQDDELGTFILRSTSFNTVDRLGSRLNQLSGLTSGKIAGMPMMLVLKAKTTTQSCREPIYFSDLVTRPGMTLIDAVKAAKSYQDTLTQAGLSLEGMEDALVDGLANSDFADELEDADEWLSDDGLVAAVQDAQQASSKGGLRGLDSLTEKLNARAKEGTAKKVVPMESAGEGGGEASTAENTGPTQDESPQPELLTA